MGRGRLSGRQHDLRREAGIAGSLLTTSPRRANIIPPAWKRAKPVVVESLIERHYIGFRSSFVHSGARQ